MSSLPDKGLNTNDPTYYQILGVDPDCDLECIKRAYHNLVRQHHPDKVRSSDDANQFRNIEEAFKTLSDTFSRILYDLKIGNTVQSPEKIHHLLLEMQQAKAEREIELKTKQFKAIREMERNKNGLIIERALYGNLRLKKIYRNFVSDNDQIYWSSTTEDLIEGPFFDVTVQLQCMVENSQIYLPGTSKQFHGFYNPAPWFDSVEIYLYVLYRFTTELYEVVISDNDTLIIPLQKHRVIFRQPRGPFAPSNLVSDFMMDGSILERPVNVVSKNPVILNSHVNERLWDEGPDPRIIFVQTPSTNWSRPVIWLVVVAGVCATVAYVYSKQVPQVHVPDYKPLIQRIGDRLNDSYLTWKTDAESLYKAFCRAYGFIPVSQPIQDYTHSTPSNVFEWFQSFFPTVFHRSNSF